ncbi:MAG: diguanylate cyclase, partial [Eubacteriales bacterium]|nr:diguanylate cyclase [Eubacteriales bacterium]
MNINKKLIGSFSILLIFFSICIFIFAFAGISYMVEKTFSSYLEAKGELGYLSLDKNYPGDWEKAGNRFYKGDTLVNANRKMVEDISKVTQTHVTIFSYDTRMATTILDDNGNPLIDSRASEEVIEQVLKQGHVFSGETKIMGKDYITYYRPITNHSGKLMGMWFVGIPKSIMQNDINYIMTVIVGILFFMLFCGIVVAHLLGTNFLKTLTNSEEKHRAVFDNAADPIFVCDLKMQILAANSAASEIFGYSNEELLKSKMDSLVKSIESTPEEDYMAMLRRGENLILGIMQTCKNGELLYSEMNAKIINWDGQEAILCICRDVTERRKAEESIIYLSYHDELTGLYNRRFYEEELKRIDTKRNLPITIIMGDANELKLINDSFGHAVGDELLRKIANILKSACRSDDIIARLGGDEFVILLPNAGPVEADQIIRRIQSLATAEKVEDLELSISFGYETKWLEEENIDEVFNKAEKYMYQKKLIERPRIRNKTIHSIIDVLYKRCPREKIHSGNVSAYCEILGAAIGVSGTALAELKAAGSLHDIGKIAVPEAILNKPVSLTEEEWLDIKRHPEIAYR